MTTLERSPPTGYAQMELTLTSSAAASPVRTSALRERAQGLRASAAAYGRKSPDFLASYDPATSSWKTSQLCLVGGSTMFSETWPRSGMMRNGIAYRLPPLARLTDGTGHGLWPTPTVNGNYNRKGASKTSGDGLATAVRIWPSPNTVDARGGTRRGNGQRQLCHVVGGALNPTWVEWLMGFPSGWTDLEPSETPSSRKSRK